MIIIYYKHFHNCSCFKTTNIYCFCSLGHRQTGLALRLWAAFRGVSLFWNPGWSSSDPVAHPSHLSGQRPKSVGRYQWSHAVQTLSRNWCCHLHPQLQIHACPCFKVSGVRCTPTWNEDPATFCVQEAGGYPWYRKEWRAGKTNRLYSPQDAAPQSFLYSQRIARFTRLQSLSFSLLKI